MCSVGDFVLVLIMIGCFGVGLLAVDVAGGVVATVQLAFPAALLLYGFWKVGEFIFQIVFPFGYPRHVIQPSAPGPHPPPHAPAHHYMFRLDRFQAPQVAYNIIDYGLDP
jgi:hypothetical protein